MKAGDLVEFKAGLFGIQPPKNLGIYLERVKRKGNFFVVLHTVKGQREVKPDNVTSRKLRARLEPPFEDEDLDARLKGFIEQFAQGELEKKETKDEEELTDKRLWELTVAGGPGNPEDFAQRYYKTDSPTRSQVGRVRNVLSTCSRPGVGFFEREPGRGEIWRPLPVEDYKAVMREIEGLNHLRKLLIRVEEVLPEDDEYARPETVLVPVPFEEAGLDDADRRRLGVVQDYMANFVLYDKDTGEVGLAGTPVHTIEGFSLSNYAKWLAIDWVQNPGSSISGLYVELLLDSGYWKAGEALVTIAKRKVLQNGSFEWETPDYVQRAAERFPREFPVEGRTDLRDKPCWTIDPPEAKDHDDAVGLEEHPDGSVTLWVHIADVSHYVEKDDGLDRHARKRATSVYLPTGVLPMLPEALSNDLCSLKSGEDRFAMTAALTFDRDLNLTKEEFFESVIRVTANVSYDEALDAIENEETESPFYKLEKLSRGLAAKRRGLPIETGERRIHITEGDIGYAIKQGNRATKMIETFMVSANEAVARKLRDEGLAVPYRCHPLPDRAGADRFNKQMETMELDIRIDLPDPAEEADDEEDGDGGGMSVLDQLKQGGKMQLLSGGFALEDDEEDEEEEEEAPQDAAPLLKGLAQLSPDEQEAWLSPFRQALSKVQALDNERLRELVYLKSLTTMGRALYTPRNLGHFGLGSTCYAHFTSPIRRYPDVLVHRQLKWVLRGKPDDEPPYSLEELEDISVHCTEQGQDAESLERGLVDASMVFVSREGHWRGKQSGLVNGMTKGGVFLGLPRGLEARLAMSELPGGPYDIDDAESMLFKGSATSEDLQEEVTGANWRDLYNEEMGEIVKVRLRLGDEIPVRISGRDYVDGRVSVKLWGAEEDAEAPGET